jgi:hypothetical protein
VLTPLEHKRLRAYGLRDIEIFLIANAATQTGLDVDSLRQLYLVHPPMDEVIYELNIDHYKISPGMDHAGVAGSSEAR